MYNFNPDEVVSSVLFSQEGATRVVIACKTLKK